MATQLHVTENKISDYIKENISRFHEARLRSLKNIKLIELLESRNPYLFKVKFILTPECLIMPILDAHLASREETLFGNFLEGLATYVCNLTKKGYKSSAEGIDLEFTADTNHHLVTIKSGPNWGNAGQIKRMKDNFRQAKHMLGQSKHHKTIVAVNGCCYGKDDNPDKGDYLRLCGQRFWEFISGDTELYTRIIEPLGTRAKEHNDDFIRKYSQVVTLFCIGFAKEFCTPEGSIDWKHLLKTISGKNK